MKVTVSDIIQIMETIAPVCLAEDWDNVGLQVGKKSWPVKKIWIALDPTFDVVETACRNKADLIITHHPLIFSPLKKVDFSSTVGRIIYSAGKHQLAIFSAHTNLDNANNGLNDILSKRVGLRNVCVLKKSNAKNYKLIVFVPSESEKNVLDALIETDAGKIKSYESCSFRCKGQGSFIPGDNAKPFKGKKGELSTVDEIRIETVVNSKELSTVLEAIRAVHPYEEMPYDVYPLLGREDGCGTGRIGDLDESISLKSFAKCLRKKLGIDTIKVAGDPDLIISRVAVCSGSGSGLMEEFLSSGAQVFVSGDLRYHDARSAEHAGLAIIDIGHFASEIIVVDELKERLNEIITKQKINVSVYTCDNEKDPFWSPDT